MALGIVIGFVIGFSIPTAFIVYAVRKANSFNKRLVKTKKTWEDKK